MTRAATARRQSAEAKRDAIFDAALALFGRYGFRRTSIDDIARAAGVAKGTVYLHVETKEALFRTLSESLLARVLADAGRAAAAPGYVGRRLTAILEAKFAFFHGLLQGSPHAGELLDSKSRLCADVFARADAAYLRVLAGAVTEAARRGELRPRRHGLGAEDVARMLMAGAHGIDPELALPAAEYRSRVAALVGVIVAGLRSR
jgi:AcrR family transcriptional regulator